MLTVYAYVVADLLHPGHVRHLERAAQLGDFLIVGILTTSATMERKPKPCMCTSYRAEVIGALRCVDRVVKQDAYSPLENVKRYMPDILAESEDHKGNDYLRDLVRYVKSYGGEVAFLPYTPKITSTKIKERIIDEYKKKKHD